MKPELRWDCSPAFAAPRGTAPTDVSQWLSRSEQLRQQTVKAWRRMHGSADDEWLVDTASEPRGGASSRESGEFVSAAERLASLLALPVRLLYDYRSGRPGNELARVFALCQRWERRVDRLILVGSSGGLSPMRAFFETVGQPLHNWLSRGERGSKPQFLFVDEQSDNDAIQAVLQLLDRPAPLNRPGDPAATALLLLDDGTAADRLGTAIDHIAAKLSQGGGGSSSEDPWPRIAAVVPTRAPGSRSMLGHCRSMFREERDFAQFLHERAFDWPRDSGGQRFAGCEIIGGINCILAGALLGLDVMQFLDGCMRQVAATLRGPSTTNPAVQVASLQAAWHAEGGNRSRAICWWHSALRPLARWYRQLAIEVLGPSLPLADVMEFAGPADCRRVLTDTNPRITHHLWVHRYRQDLLSAPPNAADSTPLQDWAQRESLERDQMIAKQRIAGRGLTTAVLASVDPRSVGQWLQSQLTAVEFERSLIAVADPSGP